MKNLIAILGLLLLLIACYATGIDGPSATPTPTPSPTPGPSPGPSPGPPREIPCNQIDEDENGFDFCNDLVMESGGIYENFESTVGVEIINLEGVTLRNCRVQGSSIADDAGISIINSRDITIEGCEVSHSLIGISGWHVENITLIHNQLHDLGEAGMDLESSAR